MKKILSCEQVSALINFYLQDCLTERLTKYVEEHLNNCTLCREKYLNLTVNNIVDDNNYETEQYELFKTNLSAYIDNELDDLDNIKIKKIAISNPLARQDLENVYLLKKLLHSAYEKTKNNSKINYSKNILNKLRYNKNIKHTFKPIAATFLIIFLFLLGGIIKMLYF